MPDVATHRKQLSGLDEEAIRAYIVENGGLPEDRVDLALVRAAAEEAPLHQLHRWVRLGPSKAPENAPEEVLAMAGVVGLGRLVADGEEEHISTLRSLASDPRWRIREAVAMAMRRAGRMEPALVLDAAEDFIEGGPFEQRAAVAGIADPGLLRETEHARRALEILDGMTEALHEAQTHDDEGLVALREALGFAWSVVVAALPEEGRARFESWLVADDPNVRWVIEQNLKTQRMHEVDPEWVERTLDRL